MKVIIINGPNLNLIGIREPHLYGNIKFEDFLNKIKNKYKKLKIHYFQSNIEGELINKIHEVGFSFDYIIINAGGYSHTSVAISDAISSVETPCIEVHITHPSSREDYRHISIISKSCTSSVSGFGLNSYDLALHSILISN